MPRAIALVPAALLLLATGIGPGSAQTQSEMNEQAGRALAKADAALNRSYDQLIAKISPAGQTALRQAQRAWITFRDQECAFETLGSEDGSVHPMVVADCKTALTRKRTQQLDAQLNCQEGDLSCGNQ